MSFDHSALSCTTVHEPLTHVNSSIENPFRQRMLLPERCKRSNTEYVTQSIREILTLFNQRLSSTDLIFFEKSKASPTITENSNFFLIPEICVFSKADKCEFEKFWDCAAKQHPKFILNFTHAQHSDFAPFYMEPILTPSVNVHLFPSPIVCNDVSYMRTYDVCQNPHSFNVECFTFYHWDIEHINSDLIHLFVDLILNQDKNKGLPIVHCSKDRFEMSLLIIAASMLKKKIMNLEIKRNTLDFNLKQIVNDLIDHFQINDKIRNRERVLHLLLNFGEETFSKIRNNF